MTRERPDFVFIMESMIDSGRLEVVRNKCGFNNGLCLVAWAILVVLVCGEGIMMLALNHILMTHFCYCKR